MDIGLLAVWGNHEESCCERFVRGLYVDNHFHLLDKYLEMELLDHRVDIRSTF